MFCAAFDVPARGRFESLRKQRLYPQDELYEAIEEGNPHPKPCHYDQRSLVRGCIVLHFITRHTHSCLFGFL